MNRRISVKYFVRRKSGYIRTFVFVPINIKFFNWIYPHFECIREKFSLFDKSVIHSKRIENSKLDFDFSKIRKKTSKESTRLKTKTMSYKENARKSQWWNDVAIHIEYYKKVIRVNWNYIQLIKCLFVKYFIQDYPY